MINIRNSITDIKNQLDLHKPSALGWDAWSRWHRDTRLARPVAYFIMQTVPDKFDDFIKFFTKPVNDLRYGLRVRIFDRYHVINTGLKPGYADMDTRMMHGLFNMLVEFVEVEKAHMQVVFDPAERKLRKHPWWSKGYTRFKSFRDAEAGLAHLKWEMTLDGANLPLYDQSPTQASAAREVWELYHWWKFVRPIRPDPLDASGWSEHCDLLTLAGKHVLGDTPHTAEELDRSTACLKKSHELEQMFDDEDEQMLIRLVKVRKSLWT